MGVLIENKKEGYSIYRDDAGENYGETTPRDFVTNIIRPGVWTVDREPLIFPDGVYSLLGKIVVIYEGQAYVGSDFVVSYMDLFNKESWVKLEWQY